MGCQSGHRKQTMILKKRILQNFVSFLAMVVLGWGIIELSHQIFIPINNCIQQPEIFFN